MSEWRFILAIIFAPRNYVWRRVAIDYRNKYFREILAHRDEIAALKAQFADHHAAVQHVTEDGKTTRSYTGDGWAMVHAERLGDLEVAEEHNARLRAILAPLISHADRHDYAPPYMINVQQCREIKEKVNVGD